ncbi:U4/U6.U5 tri-snRNP-associated protein 2 [Coelomomyces lativittatus]|nr:U4/U6.U5 tri-snRNP-associated protein 2 [Coelomomyces lativittatus]
MEVLAWLLHFLQSSIFTSTKIDLVHSIFQGTMMVETQKISLLESRKENQMEFDRSLDSTKEIVPYIALALELPPPPLFQDEFERNIIPQVSLTTLLEKYNGTAIRQYGDKLMKFRLQTLPKYLIFHIKRFIKNNWSIEKNPTIVNFSTHNLDMSPFVSDDSIKAKYNILANIVHEGKPEDGQGVYKCHVYHQALEQWFCIQDLRVEEMMPQMVSLGESYIQIWQRSEV